MSESPGIPLPPSKGVERLGVPQYSPIPLQPTPANRANECRAREALEPIVSANVSPVDRGLDQGPKRRTDLARSLVVALVINLLIIFACCFTFLELKDFGEDEFLVVAHQTAPKDKKDSPSSNSPPPSTAASESSAGRSSKAAGSVATTSSFSTFSFPTLPSINSNAIGLSDNGTELGAENVGLSLSKSDFVAVKSQRKRRAREFVEGRSSGRGSGGQGVGIGVLEGLFPGSKLGNGEGLVLFLDMSGSMQGISRDVEAYVESNFPKGNAIHIMGCSMKAPHDDFARKLTQTGYSAKNKEFYFVCDLQDGETAAGINQIRKVIEVSDYKRLHIISFDEYPGHILQRLIDDTDGTFTYIDPALSSE